MLWVFGLSEYKASEASSHDSVHIIVLELLPIVH